jgi:hypothetical protein
MKNVSNMLYIIIKSIILSRTNFLLRKVQSKDQQSDQVMNPLYQNLHKRHQIISSTDTVL